jgi:hypothetical protein
MPKSKPQIVHPSDSIGSWLTEDRRYFDNAHRLLRELESLVEEVRHRWPTSLDATVAKESVPADLWELARRRDVASDSVLIFSAMSAEAFLNFYGVVRLGQTYFDANLERLGPVAKLKELFLLCESVSLQDSDPLVGSLDRIAKRRNRLVHPRTTEVSGVVSRLGNRLPGEAQDAVADLRAFFMEFGLKDPNIAHHLPSLPSAA